MRLIHEATDRNAALRSARIIQQGLLPKKRHFDRLFSDHFVLYLPQNIISGDFYWVGKKNGLRYLVVGDCTGHGVGAALLSVLAINLFEYVIMNKGIKRVDKILREVDKRFIESFKDTEALNFDNPWIDLSVICIDDKNQKIHYAGANRKMLYLSKNTEPVVVKGKRYPIGGWQLETYRDFAPSSFNYQQGDMLYIGSDGFQDQIGGCSNKKYKSNRLHQFLKQHSHLSFEEQQRLLENEHFLWKGKNEQTDDICLVGICL